MPRSEENEMKFQAIKARFIATDMELQDFSREKTGNDADPPYTTLCKWAMASSTGNNGVSWSEERSQYQQVMSNVVNGVSINTHLITPLEAESTELEGVQPTAIAKQQLFQGRYQPYVSNKLAASITRSLQDPYFHSLADEIAIVDVYTQELMSRLNDVGAPDGLWLELKDIVGQLKLAYANHNDSKVSALSLQITQMIEVGGTQAALWTEIFHSIGRRAQLIDTESKRLQRQNAVIPVEALMQFMAIFKTKLQRIILEDELSGKELWTELSDICDQLISQTVEPIS